MFKRLKDILNMKSTEEDKIEKSQILMRSLEDNISMFKRSFAENDLVVYRNIRNQHDDKLDFCLIYVDGMIDNETVQETIILPLLGTHMSSYSLDYLADSVLSSRSIEKSKNIDELVKSIIYGDSVLLLNGSIEALVMDTKGWEKRQISEPIGETAVRGPREGFTESIETNLTLIWKRIINPDLKMQYMEIGRQTKTKVCICYLKSLAHQEIIDELRKRLGEIEIDGILESGYIESFIHDAPLSPFETIGSTERPDVVAGKLLEGRVAVVCDGTPFVLTLPHLFIEYFQFNEDYYHNFIFASFNRILRVIAFFLSTSIPAIYIALTTYHQEMIPTPLLLSISSSRQGVPFPTVFEALSMGITFEILREAGTRLPKPIGQTVSIVGALVLGEAAVTARIVSAPIVIVTALTGITSLMLPKMLGALAVIRFSYVILASFLGLYGYIFGVIGLFIHLMSIRSFGIPYMLQLGSINKQDIKDTIIRAPWWYMYYRPKLIGGKNPVRSGSANLRKRG
ncbi:spore germination protein KA [Anaerosolibacter carboniphilus]|uniref:Spore germination protein KA n=1 Tax=Anaerosolibacter carboniphilus TaxID=1417629 RepID=A0A841KTW7_9FIRM|nr:spore germination protein [Anaerosolibacter carboniphilus]MBB6216871.1 spore germination protein KA [Anaerosolibacter carboniphilus]